MALHTESHVVAVVLDHFYVDKVLAEALNDTEQGTFYEDVACQLVQCELTLQKLCSALLSILLRLVKLSIKMQD